MVHHCVAGASRLREAGANDDRWLGGTISVSRRRLAIDSNRMPETVSGPARPHDAERRTALNEGSPREPREGSQGRGSRPSVRGGRVWDAARAGGGVHGAVADIGGCRLDVGRSTEA